MSEKKYTPYEVAVEVLKKAQEVYNLHKSESKKEDDNKKEIDKCGEMSKDEDSINEAVEQIMGDKHGVNDVMSKLPKEKRAKVLAALRNRDAKKAEMCKGWMDKAEEVEKCGEMQKAHDNENKKEDPKEKKKHVEKCGEIKVEKNDKNLKKVAGVTSQGAPLGGNLGSSIAAGLSGGAKPPVSTPPAPVRTPVSKKETKLSSFLKKKKMNKAMGEKIPKSPEAPKAPKAGSPQPQNVSQDQGWSDSSKIQGK